MVRTLPVIAMLTAVGLGGCSQPSGPVPPAGGEAAAVTPAAGDLTETAAEPNAAAREEDVDASAAAAVPAVGPEADAPMLEPSDGAGAGESADELDAALAAEVNSLLTQMSSDASLERLAAGETLDGRGAVIVPYLAAALEGGSEAERRGAAAYLIGRVSPRDDQLVTALIGALAAPDDVLRHHALQAVEKLTPEQVVQALPALTGLAQNPQEATAYRVRAVRAIAKPGAASREALPWLRRTAQDPALPELQRAALDAVAKVATPEETEAFLLEMLAQSPDADLRRLAAKRLVQAALTPAAITGLVAALQDPAAESRNEAVKSLVAIGKPAIPQLIEALRHSDVQVRRHAVTALGQMNRLAAEAAADLEACLQDPDPEVRTLAAAALRLVRGQ